MNNIVWQQPGEEIAVTSIFNDSNPIEHAALLQSRGDIPSNWVCVSSSYDGPFPVDPQETWEWSGTSIVANSFLITKQAHESLVSSAQAALTKSDITVVRCYSAGVAVPAANQTYRNALRAIVNGTDTTSTVLPSEPTMPVGI